MRKRMSNNHQDTVLQPEKRFRPGHDPTTKTETLSDDENMTYEESTQMLIEDHDDIELMREYPFLQDLEFKRRGAPVESNFINLTIVQFNNIMKSA